MNYKDYFRILKTLDLSSVEEKSSARSSLKNCIYLQDTGVELFGFLKIWGSPWYMIIIFFIIEFDNQFINL